MFNFTDLDSFQEENHAGRWPVDLLAFKGRPNPLVETRQWDAECFESLKRSKITETPDLNKVAFVDTPPTNVSSNF